MECKIDDECNSVPYLICSKVEGEQLVNNFFTIEDFISFPQSDTKLPPKASCWPNRNTTQFNRLCCIDIFVRVSEQELI
jgi:hypothetical protein